LQSFRIMATCSTPTGPHGASDAWAVVVHAREAGVDEPQTRDKKIIITLQSAWNGSTPHLGRPGARMNTPLPPPIPPGSGSGPWLALEIFDLLFPGVSPPW